LQQLLAEVAVKIRSMKAKEYFEKYINENQDKSKEWRFIKCLQEMILEVNEIAKMRNAKYDRALIAIFNEQNMKAISFIKKVNEIDGTFYKIDAFKIFLKEESPEMYKLVWLD